MGFGTGLSGLNAASKNLDVIGHNIANANTTGMKAGRAEFAEVYAATIGASGGSNGGIGVSVANVAQLFTQGNIKITGNNLDMAINGDGFFKVTLTDGSTAYTRNGEFKLDKDGYIVTNNGARLQGYQTDTAGKPTSVVTSDIKLPTGGVIDPKASTEIAISANLNATVDIQSATPPDPLTDDLKTFGTALNVYDPQGVAIPVQVYFVKTAANTWNVITQVQPKDPLQPVVQSDLGPIAFDPQTGKPAAAPALSLTIATDTYAIGTPAADLTVALNFGEGTADEPYTITQYGTNFSVFDVKQDGYAPGELTSISIGEDGIITSRYSNGVSQASGQVMLTRFRNVQGLEPVNGGYWQKTAASGEPVEGQAQTGRFGLIRSGALEESNVDLTQELVNMIVAQRAYQANAQTIKTQDQVQQTLVNLR